MESTQAILIELLDALAHDARITAIERIEALRGVLRSGGEGPYVLVDGAPNAFTGAQRFIVPAQPLAK